MPSSTEDGAGCHGTANVHWLVETHAQLPSTSDHVRMRAAEGAPEGLVVVAGQQTAGRGRHGRTWMSPLGNLYLTLLLRPATSPRQAGGLALMAGLSLAQASVDLGAACGQLRLKWPNDLMAGDAKVAGILLEADSDAVRGLAWVSIGIGVNVIRAPEVPGRPSAALADIIPGVDADGLRVMLLDRVALNYAQWKKAGIGALRSEWCRHALEPGTRIQVKPGRDILDGTYVGIDDDGALLVDVGVVRRVTTGEVLLAGEALAAASGTA